MNSSASISPSHLPRYRRVENYPPIKIGRPRQLILEAIARFDLLTAQQVTRLLFSVASLTYVREHLKDLFHTEYVQRVFLPTITPHGSSRAVYCLDYKGHAYLKRQGLAVSGRFRPDEKAEVQWMFLRHTLATNDLIIAALAMGRERKVQIAQILTEHELKRRVVYVRDGKEMIGVASDAWVDFRTGQTQTCIAFELDRGTVERKPFQRKIRGLVRFCEGPYQEAFETDSLTIAFVTTAGDSRLAEMISWTEKELERISAKGHAELFCFAALDPAATDPSALFLAPLFVRPFDSTPVSLLNPAELSA